MNIEQSAAAAAVIHGRRRRNVPWLQVQSVFNGTPFKPVIWRLPGVRMGKRVFGGNPARELARPADPKPSPSTLAPAQVG